MEDALFFAAVFSPFLIPFAWYARRQRAAHRKRCALLRRLELGGATRCRSVAQLQPDAVCEIEGVVASAAVQPAPLTDDVVVGFRLVAVIEPGVSSESRRKVLDLTRTLEFGLRDQGGRLVRIRDSHPELLAWPPLRLELPLAALPARARRLLEEEAPGSLPLLGEQPTIFWSQWLLRPDDPVRVIALARRVASATAGSATYREPPQETVLEAPPGGRAFLVRGSIDAILSAMEQSPLDFPGHVSRRPRGGPRLGI